jgi:hypothetical protein
VKIIDLPIKTFSSGNIQDFSAQLGPSGIQNLFRLLYSAYLRLCESGKIKEPMTEPEITEELYVKLQQIVIANGDSAIIPCHEKAHKKTKTGPGKTPTIDLCFRDDFDSEAYFGFECKKLETSNKKRFDDYIVGGVCRYLSGAYSKKSSKGSMISFVINGNITKIVSEIKCRVDNICCLSKMEKAEIIDGFSNQFESRHRRSNMSPFHLYHLFFEFPSK